MSKILLVIPSWGDIAPQTAMFLAACSRRPDTMAMCAKGRPHDYARNQVIRSFLKNEFLTHIFFVDSDVAPPVDAIDRLLALNTPVASGIYRVIGVNCLQWACANADANGCYRLVNDLPSDAPFYCDAVGAGCLMLRRDVFDKIQWPWFKWVEHPDGSQTSEDIEFFRKANIADLKVLCDPAVNCSHFKTVDLKTLRKI